jgi:hypothetical protein
LFDLGRRRACRFARRAVVFPPAMGAGIALRAHVFPLPVGAWGAHRAVASHLAVGAAVAHRAPAFHPAVVAARTAEVRAVGFQLPVRARVARRAGLFHPAVGTRVTLLAGVFSPSVRAPLICTSHCSPLCALNSALRPRRAKIGVVAFVESSQKRKKRKRLSPNLKVTN